MIKFLLEEKGKKRGFGSRNKRTWACVYSAVGEEEEEGRGRESYFRSGI